MDAIAHRFYLFGYRAKVLPRFLRRLIARSDFHRAWLAGHMGVFEQHGARCGVSDREVFQYRN